MHICHRLNEKTLLAGLLVALIAAPAFTAPIVGTVDGDTINVESLAESIVESVLQDFAIPVSLAGRSAEWFSGLGYWQADSDATARTRIGSLGQTFTSQGAEALEAELGVRFALFPDANVRTGFERSERRRSVRSLVEVAYIRDLAYQSGGTIVRFDDAPGYSYLLGARVRRPDALRMSWDSQLKIDDTLMLSAKLGGVMRGSELEGAARLEIRKQF